MRGDLDDAEPMYAQRTGARRRTGDDRQLEAMIAQNLGMIASMRGDLTRGARPLRREPGDYRARRAPRSMSARC